MLGTLLAGLRCCDEHEAGGGVPWLVLGVGMMALGLALKIVAVYVLVPLAAVIWRPRRPWKIALALSMTAPALLWYVYAAVVMAQGGGSRASADNGAIWLRVLV